MRKINNELDVPVHFFHSSEIEIRDMCSDWTIMKASVANIQTDADLLKVIAITMQFPDYFGHNWDAFDECINDMSWLPAKGYLLTLGNADKAWAKNPYLFGVFTTIWLQAALNWKKENIPFHLVFIMD